MNTTPEAISKLQTAHQLTQEAQAIIADLIAPHDYQDVAVLVAQAAASLLTAATAFMQSNDEEAFSAIEQADDALEAVFEIVEGDLEDD